jgi:hypothetical protein
MTEAKGQRSHMTNFGKQVEDFIGELVSKPYILDFVFLRPSRYKNGQRRELCDLMIELDKAVVCLQIKGQDRGYRRTGQQEQRWVVKHLEKGFAQARGALRVLKLGLSAVEGNNPRRGIVCFKKGELKPAYGVVLVDYKGTPFPLSEDLPRRTLGDTPVHYFTFYDFLGLSDHLGTLPDLLRYLSERSQIPSWSTPLLGNEQDAYAYQLTHSGKFASTVTREHFDEQWQKLTTEYAEEYAEKIEEDKFAKVINRMIDEVHNIDPKQAEYMPNELREQVRPLQQRKEEYIQIATELNKLPKLERRAIGKMLFEKAKLSAETGRPRYFGRLTEKQDMILVFVATSLPRKNRIIFLHNVTYAAAAHAGVRKALGVAVEDISGEGHSFDFLLFDGVDPNDSSLKNQAKTLFAPPQHERLHDFPREGRRILLPNVLDVLRERD